jgi:hypothetical protein
MTDLLSPERVHELIGLQPVTLRDRRRRHLLPGVGVLALPGGGWTKNPDEPRVERKGDKRSGDRWLYTVGDVLVLAIAGDLAGMGVDLKSAIWIASHISSHVLAWAVGTECFANEREPRYAIAWPTSEGSPMPAGYPLGELQFVRLSELSRIPEYAGPKAIFIDFEKMASALPAPLKAYLRERYADSTAKEA